MPDVDYSHEMNRALHTVGGATAAVNCLFPGGVPSSVLDIGCGTGTWLRAMADRGAADIFGVDGLVVDDNLLFIDKTLIRHFDLNLPIDLQRQFDLVISLETAEHIEPANAGTFVDSLVAHGKSVLFSAAAPGQGGTHHVNCQWLDYWQALFNDRGFVCDDDLRWKIWDDQRIEPWYRQNLMSAKHDPARAGTEPRIRRVIHPDLLFGFSGEFLDGHRTMIERGGMPWAWYPSSIAKALKAKVAGRLG